MQPPSPAAPSTPSYRRQYPERRKSARASVLWRPRTGTRDCVRLRSVGGNLAKYSGCGQRLARLASLYALRAEHVIRCCVRRRTTVIPCNWAADAVCGSAPCRRCLECTGNHGAPLTLRAVHLRRVCGSEGGRQMEKVRVAVGSVPTCDIDDAVRGGFFWPRRKW